MQFAKPHNPPSRSAPSCRCQQNGPPIVHDDPSMFSAVVVVVCIVIGAIVLALGAGW